MSQPPSKLLHRFAISTVCVALVTLTMGALTTSKNAGMAFRDWPTSDGVGMFAYPWLNDFARDWDKFLEHGHRLAGALIGMWSIALVVFAFRSDQRRWVRGLSVGILLGVICQGLLGGFRVQLDERGLAMLHGLFAALVFSTMGAMVLVTSHAWSTPAAETDRQTLSMMKGVAVLTIAVLFSQYILGGFIRHQGWGLHEHLGLGVVTTAVIFANAIICGNSENPWLRGSAWTLLFVTLFQVGLGAGTWVLKFGFASLGYVAIADSIQQVTMRTAHTVWGCIVLMTAMTHLLKVFRVSSVSKFAPMEMNLRLRPVATGGDS